MVVGEMVEKRDLMVIGGGPGGYHAALRAAQLGKQVTLIEQGEIGGACLNEGCIPSKILTHFASEFRKQGHLQKMGMVMGEASIDLAKLKSFREEKIKGLRAGVEGLLRSRGVEVINGTASFLSENRIGIESGHQFSLFEFKQAIVAIGGKMVYPPGISMESPFVLTEREALTMTEIPEGLIVSGHDYVAIEIAAAYAALGSTVTLLMEGRLPFDQSIEREMKRLLKKQKVSVVTEVTIMSVSDDGGVEVDYESSAGTRQVNGTHLVLCGKSEADLSRAGLDRLPLECEGGKIKVDGEGRTSIPGVWAIGDVTPGPGLAIKAIKEGKVAAGAIAGDKGEVDLEWLPAIVQMDPPVACAGWSEEEAEDRGYEVVCSEYPFRANGFAGLKEETDGMIKIVSEKGTSLILGIHMIGSGAVELISAGVLGLEMAARAEDFTFPLYPHPSSNEALMEAVEELTGHAVHLQRRRKKAVQ